MVLNGYRLRSFTYKTIVHIVYLSVYTKNDDGRVVERSRTRGREAVVGRSVRDGRAWSRRKRKKRAATVMAVFWVGDDGGGG